MKKKTLTLIMLLAALTFGFTSCQSELKKETKEMDGEHTSGDGHEHSVTDGHDHSRDSLGKDDHREHDHAEDDSTHTDSHGHKH